MRLGTHSAGSGAAGTEAGASRPRTPGRETRCVCGRTALRGDAAGRWGTPAKKARPGGALRLRPHGAGGGTAGRTADIGVIIGLSCNLQDHIKEALMYLNTLLTMV